MSISVGSNPAPVWSELSLFPATLEQTIESRKRSFKSWGKQLTEEQYLLRDKMLQTEGAGGKLTTWVLAPRNDPTTLDFKCSCGTYRRIALIHNPKSSSPPSRNQPYRVPSYAIASVFTPPQNRGKGYAKHMMRLLHWVLAPPHHFPHSFPAIWGEPPQVEGYNDAQFSVLYSDVGDRFYWECGPGEGKGEGWTMRGNESTFFDLGAGKRKLEADGLWTPLKEEDLPMLWDRDVDDVTYEFPSLATKDKGKAPSRSPVVRFAFLPDKSISSFQVRRIMLYSPRSPSPTPSPSDAPSSTNRRASNASTSALSPKARKASVGSIATSSSSTGKPSSPRSSSIKIDPNIEITVTSPLKYWGVVLLTPFGNFPERNEELTFATWTLDISSSSSSPPTKTIAITRLRATPETFKDLLARIFECVDKDKCGTDGISLIEVWNLPKDLGEIAESEEVGGRTVWRKEHLPAVKWYGEESGDDVEWVCNERFAWC